jgi:hypothetical protein
LATFTAVTGFKPEIFARDVAGCYGNSVIRRLSSEMWSRALWYIGTNVSEEIPCFILRQKSKSLGGKTVNDIMKREHRLRPRRLQEGEQVSFLLT